jgi:hypothetical protein
MNLNDKVVTTIIAGGISTIGFVLTYYAARRKTRQELELFDRKLSNNYVEKLYELRIKHYGKAFEITDLVGKKIDKTLGELPYCHQEVLKEIRAWKSGEVNLVISEEALLLFYTLIEHLQLSVDAEGIYTEVQLKELWNVRTNFRVALRSDLGLLHSVNELDL